jgi:hypothetical protein
MPINLQLFYLSYLIILLAYIIAVHAPIDRPQSTILRTPLTNSICFTTVRKSSLSSQPKVTY